MPPTNLTAEQIRLIGQLLVPLVKDALAPELEHLRADLRSAIGELKHDLAGYERRLSVLEHARSKLLAIWGAIWGILTLAGSSLLQAIHGWINHK